MIVKFQFAAFKLDSEHHRFQHHPKPKHTIFKFSWSLTKKHMGVDFLVIRGVHQYMQKQKINIFQENDSWPHVQNLSRFGLEKLCVAQLKSQKNKFVQNRARNCEVSANQHTKFAIQNGKMTKLFSFFLIFCSFNFLIQELPSSVDKI